LASSARFGLTFTGTAEKKKRSMEEKARHFAFHQTLGNPGEGVALGDVG
jgi:hypothetical protein